MTSGAASDRPNLPRPSVVTLACLFVAITASLSLIELITALTNWGSIEMADQARQVVKDLRERGVTISVSELLVVSRWAALALVPLAVSLAVCAVFAMRGDRRSRTVTSVLAVGAGLMSLTSGVLGLIPATMMFLAAGALWSPDARRWYRGQRASAQAFADPSSHPVDASRSRESSALDSPASGTPSVESASADSDRLPPPPAPTVRSSDRPGSVVAAGVVAIAGSLLAALFATFFLVLNTQAHDAYVEAVQTGPFGTMVTRDELETVLRILSGISLAVLPVAAVGLVGGLALMARRRFGRTALFVWAWCTAGLGVLLLPLGLVATAGAIAVLVLLRRDDARDWITGSI